MASAVVQTAISDAYWNEVQAILLATRTELCLFAVAILAYFLLFRINLPSNRKAKQAKDRQPDDEDTSRSLAVLQAMDNNQLSQSFKAAYESGDHRHVLRCWNVMKKLDAVPTAFLAQALHSLHVVKKDAAQASEVKAFFKKYPAECNIQAFNGLLASNSELMDLLPTLGLSADEKTYEILLNAHFVARNFVQVNALVAEMKSKQVDPTTRAIVSIIKTGLKCGDFAGASAYFQTLKDSWQGTTISTAPRQIVAQLVDLACKDHQLKQFLPMLEGVPLTSEVIGVLLLECARQKDAASAIKVEDYARAQNVELSHHNISLLVKALSGDSARVQEIFEDVLARGCELAAEFALAILGHCSQSGSVAMVNKLYEAMRMSCDNAQVLSAFVRFYAENDLPEKACAVFEQHFIPKGLLLDHRIERSFMSAAMKCGRSDLAQKFLDASPTDVSKHVAMIRNCGATGNLKGAKDLFNSLIASGVEMNAVIYNTVLDACVECRNLEAAESWMGVIKEKGFVDVVSYNTMIKAYLQIEDFAKAKSLVSEMKVGGLQPNRVTFNELVNGLVSKDAGNVLRRSEIWALIREMTEAGVGPNQVTCSILLKNLNASSKEEDIMATMELMEAVEEPMDEVLLSSVVEACVRIGKPELLLAKLKKVDSFNVTVNGSHTFGSLIKAYGHAKDMESVWRCWKDMRSRNIRPTSITLGCMVEAVVNKGDIERALGLIHEIKEDARCHDALNSVIYCSVLKGFAREKKLQRVWQVYEEMLSSNIDLSIVTYNTLLDACARCGRMDRVPSIFEDMESKGIQPNLITYSTALKGHCNVGDVRQAFSIMEKVRTDGKLKPDEIMYNSLLDGCAQNGLVEEGLELLKQMAGDHVTPSNFTLSLLVKLMSRAKRLDCAFNIVEETATKYHLQPNVHVYTNLIQACVVNRKLPRAMTTFQTMIQMKIQPESRTYALLVRTSLASGGAVAAGEYLRAALGLTGGPAFLVTKQEKSVAICNNLDYGLVGETLQTLVQNGNLQDVALPLMADIRRNAPHVRIDPAIQRWIMSAGMAEDSGKLMDAPPPKQEGKGSGKGKVSRSFR